jgi:hypothetical protein
MAKILKNQTTSVINLDIGLSIPASGQITLNPQDFDEASASDDIVQFVGSGDIIVNDGSFDLTKSDGIRLIQGGFSNKIQVDEDLISSDRVKIDVTGNLSMDDGTIKVSGNDSLAAFLEDKLVSGSSKLSRTVQNEGSNENILIDVVSSNINTADLNNDAGFITSGQAPVQPGDIANFETSTQLDARDTANRDRSNHTGTQVSSTISDFNTAVQAAETTTSISFATNILTYVDEDGNSTNIDLSLFLDDTNLARLVSGTLNPTTGLLTVTRDDSSTFTIDLSALLDNQTAAEVPVTPTGNLTSTDVQSALVEIQQEVDLNTPKVSADGSIDTHSDVDVTTTTPTAGDSLVFDGANFVPQQSSNDYTIFTIWAEENGGLTNNNRQWSFGNGATGNINIVLPIDAELFAVSFDAEIGTGTVTMDIYKNDSNSFTTNALTNKDFQTLGVPVSFAAGDCVGFRTNTETGSLSDARVAAWFRVNASAVSTSVLNDLLDVSISGLASGQSLVYNGSNFVNVDIVKPSELATVATTGAYSDLIGLPTLGTAADNAETDFATAAQGALADSAVQPADIVNFETTTQLNVRDTNNRDRSNHTGTQLSTTISDFAARVQTEETTTSLSFNNTTKILTYTDEDGGTTDVDLTQFLDDTNLARITSGTLNSSTGIATFTRDDSSTFTVDFSALNDQAFINAAIATHETTINNHDDVDVTTNAPVSGDILEYDGTNWTPSKGNFKDFISKTTIEGTQLTTFQQYLRLATTVPEAGNYKISWNYEWSLNTTGSDFLAQIQLDDLSTLMFHREEPQDSGGTGVTVTAIEGGTFNSGTDQRRGESGFGIINLTSGLHNIDLDLTNSVAATEATIYRATITIERWK